MTERRCRWLRLRWCWRRRRRWKGGAPPPAVKTESLPLSCFGLLFLLVFLFAAAFNLAGKGNQGEVEEDGEFENEIATPIVQPPPAKEDFDPSSWGRDVILPRLSLLRSECGRRSRRRIEAEEEDPRLPRGYVSDPASGLAYCHVPKAASTFWLEKFARTLHPGMTQEEMEEILLKRGELHRLMLTNATDAPSSSSFRFVFVRHPLRRLASAYLSKFAPKHGDGDGDDQERAAFLRPLLRFLRRRSKEGRLPRRAGIGFPDFVDFVVDELQRDKVSFGTFHWSPAHRLCGVCLPGREPSMVGKLETMEGDLAYLRHRFPSALGRGGESGEEKRVNVGGRGEKEYRALLRQLRRDQLSDLCKLYQGDLDMFGYDCDME